MAHSETKRIQVRDMRNDVDCIRGGIRQNEALRGTK